MARGSQARPAGRRIGARFDRAMAEIHQGRRARVCDDDGRHDADGEDDESTAHRQRAARPAAIAVSRMTTSTAATIRAAHPESRNVVGGGAGRGGRLVRGTGTSPGWRTVRGAARVSAAVARHVAHVRVEAGVDG